MVSKQFSFRLADEVVEALEGLQLEGESLNQTAQRILTKSVGLSTSTSTHLSTPVDIKELVKQEVENAIANSEQLKEMIAANTAYLATGINEIKHEVDERLGELSA
ncbi:hypothetical protein [Nostoc sp. CHAB 5715]|uniref:hypothetical protein n=1 Tax=Nostoc sp. CHAB 5715 TaxID=2780400 RepID=UPI001E5393EF|nr:hypothetical protein [Nostoc sp. CHAB 5715]MCC5625706.1 hypothetical protein [Nostoc sp. CHAB 5715]